MRNYIVILLCLLLFSCKKEKLEIITSENLSISQLTEGIEDNNVKYITQLRLAFGKTVANAMKNTDFRKYILAQSLKGGHNYFDEIVFALHKDDHFCHTTLKDVIEESVDEEVMSLFGNGLVQNILIYDPLVTIKIPDIFRNIDWDTDNVSPLIVVATPKPILNNGSGVYKSYHQSGFQNIINPGQAADFFSIIIKYSEDYFYIDFETRLNESMIGYESILPQTMTCWDQIKNDVLPLSTPSPSAISSSYYVFKQNLMNAFDANCNNIIGYSPLIEESCNDANCFRSCRSSELTYTYIDSIYFKNDIIYNHGILYNESINYMGEVFYGNNQNFQTKLVPIYGYRYQEIFNSDINIELNSENFDFDGKTINLPSINYTLPRSESKFAGLKVSLEINNDWNDSANYLNVFYYKVNYNSDWTSFETNYNSTIPAEDIFNIGDTYLNYCSNPDAYSSVGQSIAGGHLIKYKY